MKKTLSLCLAILMVLSFSACASSQSTSSQAPAASMPASSAAPSANTPAVDPIKLTMANVDTETHPCSIITVKFSELVNELSGGAMEVDYYLAGILGEEEATAEACLSGEIGRAHV